MRISLKQQGLSLIMDLHITMITYEHYGSSSNRVLHGTLHFANARNTVAFREIETESIGTIFEFASVPPKK